MFLFESGTLWTKVQTATQHALGRGALKPILTDCEVVEQENIPFVVRILSNLVRKEKAQQKQVQITKKQGKSFNPFLPHDPDLFVTDLSETHFCLLNKFNVVDHHLLIITKAFEEQENWLNLQDFIALAHCLAEFDGLGFYNGGKLAGASQPHKHLQLIPFPICQLGGTFPTEKAIASAQFKGDIGIIPAFPFQNACYPLEASLLKTPEQAAAQMLAVYYRLLRSLDFFPEHPLTPQQTKPYNCLMTRNWMWIVPRTQAEYHTIPVNSLGFAGTFFVRNEEQLQQLKTWQPLTILSQVASGS
ncbi:ATP adenylyltransferase family protein [Spirulina subsalsa]|uniref:ATP adenylyltransferase family protein n=1 Tax=Spirulina subsalsa TaxID=54311 RepID=UPI000474E1DD|nr:DUF4922 domain-containing protein [Spirulina subsalsa]